MYARLCIAWALFLCTYSFVVAGGNAGTPLSLQDAVREALKNNGDLRVAYHDQMIAGADVTSAGLRQNPTLNVIGDILPAPGEQFQPGSKYYGASVSFPLDLFSHRSSKVDAALGQQSIAQQQYQDNVRQLRLQVESAFYTSLALRERLALARLNLSRLNDFVALSKIRAAQQDIPQVDVTRAEFTRNLYDADVRDIGADFRTSLVELQTILGRTEISDSLALTSTIEDVVPPDSIPLDTAVMFAYAHRPDYQALQKQIDAEEANAKLQNSLAYPDLAVSLDFSRQQDVDFIGASLNIGLPVFDRNQGEIEKSGYKQSQAAIALEALKHKVRSEIATAYDEMTSKWQTVQQQKNTILPQAEDILKSIEYAYKIGNTTLLDYLDAQRSYTESRISYIQTLLDYHVSQSVFESALSKED